MWNIFSPAWSFGYQKFRCVVALSDKGLRHTQRGVCQDTLLITLLYAYYAHSELRSTLLYGIVALSGEHQFNSDVSHERDSVSRIPLSKKQPSSLTLGGLDRCEDQWKSCVNFEKWLQDCSPIRYADAQGAAASSHCVAKVSKPEGVWFPHLLVFLLFIITPLKILLVPSESACVPWSTGCADGSFLLPVARHVDVDESTKVLLLFCTWKKLSSISGVSR